MRILVATDLTARSDRAVARSFLLAQELKAQLRVLHVVDADLPKELKEHTLDWAKQALAAQTEKLSKQTGIDAALDVCAGHAVADVARYADSSMTDLVVLGIHSGLAPKAESFAESTAGRILKSTLTATLIVRCDATEPYRHTVVGIDFSIFARAAVRQALTLAAQSSVTLVHAYHVPFQGFLSSGDFAGEIAHDQRLEFDAFVQDEMGTFVQRSQNPATMPDGFKTVIQEGEPLTVIRSVCERIDADLVVVATHGRTGVSRAIWGSVATDLLNDPPCDLLVVKPY